MPIEEMIAELLAAEKEVRGDGFGYAGELKSRYKKVIRALEELREKLNETPPTAEVESLIAANPDCFGYGVNNAPECKCRKVFNTPVIQR